MEAPAAFVCGMGGSAIGGDLAGRGALRPAHQADAGRPRLRAALLGAGGLGRALLELLGRHRGDPRLLRRRRGAGRPAAGGDDRRRARRGRARRRRPRDRPARPASSRGRRSATCSASRPSSRRWRWPVPGSTPRSTPPPRTSGGPSRRPRLARARSRPRSAMPIPVIYGSDLTAPVAYRWKTQVNENAKIPAFSATLPEADHNELEGWSGAEGRFAAIFLEDRDQHPRERRRFELTAKAIEPYAAAVIRRRDGGRDPHRARAPRGDAGRPGRDRAGQRARGRPAARSTCSRGSRRRWAGPTGPSPAAPRAARPPRRPPPCRSPSARRP